MFLTRGDKDKNELLSGGAAESCLAADATFETDSSTPSVRWALGHPRVDRDASLVGSAMGRVKDER